MTHHTQSTTFEPGSWLATFRAFLHPSVHTMLFLGFSAGIPILLIFSSLSLWLGEAGVERKAVTFFSWAALGYSFKFIWAPLVDLLPIPVLTKLLGRRRAWLLLSQCMVIAAIVWMGSIDPALSSYNLTMMAFAAVLLGFSSATQDVVIDAFRIEIADVSLQGLASSAYIAGYRLGMILAGAGVLFLAEWGGTSAQAYLYSAWQGAYYAMAAAMLIGVATTFMVREPGVRSASAGALGLHTVGDYVRLLALFVLAVGTFVATFTGLGWAMTQSAALQNVLNGSILLAFLLESLRFVGAFLAGGAIGVFLAKAGLVPLSIVQSTWIDPVADFFKRYGGRTAWTLLALIGLYRISDIVLGVISNVFYQDMGFSKGEIATAVKTFAVLISIFGGFAGGMVVMRIGVVRSLLWGAILAAVSNLVFVVLAQVGHDLFWLYAAVTVDNLAAGFAGAAFVAFLSSLTNISFTATQYALFSSLMTLIPKVLGGYSGTIVTALGYSIFFIITTLIGLPVILLVLRAVKFLPQRQGDV